jgi:Uma2 family endonuclease
MNEVMPRPRRAPTQAAEGLPRWRWTVDDLDRMIEAGVLTENDRVELIGGELVPMAAKGIRHENIKGLLADCMYRRLPDELILIPELGWRPDEETYCEPDILIAPRTRNLSKIAAPDVLLLIEIADTTLKFDSKTKAALYSGLGIREYWIIDAGTLDTHVYRKPTARGYRHKTAVAASETLSPLLVPSISVRLHDLGIDQD